VFEIRFESPNFQATGNNYLKPTATNFVHGDRPSQDRSPPHPPLTPQGPPEWTLRALQHLDAVGAPVSALGRRGRNDDWPRASPHNATRSLA
jgi:hypothetical protein